MSESSQDTMRVFCALTLDHGAIAATRRIISAARETVKGFRWVPPENWHITLKFLGDVQVTGAAALKAALRKMAGPAIPVRLSRMGAFPDLRQPRVLWVGVDDTSEEMLRLVGRIEDACEELGYERERRRFRPHLTVARSQRATRQSGPQGEDVRHETMLRQLVLFRSYLSSAGARYEPLVEIPLGSSGLKPA